MRMNLQEVRKRQKEIAVELKTADMEQLNSLHEETEWLAQRKKQIEIEELHSRMNVNTAGGEGGVNLLEKPDHQQQQPQARSYTQSDEVYKRAWAKSLMLSPLTKEETEAINVVNKRALGSALTTTATTFTEPTALADGVNNGGLLIPTSVVGDLLQTNTLQSPILRDVMKLNIDGKVSFPYKKSSTGANFVAENAETTDKETEWAEFTLTGKELAETVRTTWKLESMTPDSFITYLVSELQTDMTEGLSTAVIYGAGGANAINGISNTSIQFDYAEGDNLIEHIANGFLKIPKKKRIGAKAYVSDEVYTKLTLQKDDAGNYVYRQDGDGKIKISGRYEVESDPFLQEDDFVIGNLGRYFKLNESEKMTITKDVSGKQRINEYTAYGVYDGNFEPGTILFGTKA